MRAARAGLGMAVALAGCVAQDVPVPESPDDTDPVADTDLADTDPPADTDDPGPAALAINELLADNAGSLAVGDATPDWVELYNADDRPVDLRGFFLSDDPDEPRRHRFDRTLVVPARGFVLLLADGDAAAGPEHLAFSLSAAGEHLVLTDSRGRRLDWVTYAPQDADVAVARVVDGSELDGWVYVYAGTPGATNAP